MPAGLPPPSPFHLDAISKAPFGDIGDNSKWEIYMKVSRGKAVSGGAGWQGVSHANLLAVN